MFCSKCGRENIDDAAVCVQCGATLGKQESPAAAYGRKLVRGI
jgi:uncharacterized membrane protein YvbJ